jgi:hypothetical protein
MVLSHLLSMAFGFAAAGLAAGALLADLLAGALAFTVALASARRLFLLPAFADFEFFAAVVFLPLVAGEPLPDERDLVRVVFDFARGAWSFWPC